MLVRLRNSWSPGKGGYRREEGDRKLEGRKKYEGRREVDIRKERKEPTSVKVIIKRLKGQKGSPNWKTRRKEILEEMAGKECFWEPEAGGARKNTAEGLQDSPAGEGTGCHQGRKEKYREGNTPGKMVADQDPGHEGPTREYSKGEKE